LEDLHRLCAEATRRHVDGAPHRFIGLPIVGSKRDAEEGQCVLDLGALIKSDVTNEHVWNARAHQRLFESTREKITAVEDRHIVPGEALARASLDFHYDAQRLGFSIMEADDFDRIAGFLPREESLPEPFSVLGDDGVRRVENMAGRTEILFEPDLRR